MLAIPKSTQVLVVGGGPAGATAATLLARQGFDVTVLEMSRFPRYHIGESLLPSILEILDLIGAREKFEACNYQRKQGAYLEWGRENWSLNFGELDGNNTYSFQVARDEFDKFMLDHARSQGVRVFEGVEVRALSFDPSGRPVCAAWHERNENNGHGDESGEISFDYIIDSSGRSGLISTHYLNNRKYHNIFQNIAIWGYWDNANRMATGREGDIAVGSIDNGWLWAIPLVDDKMSVGVVLHRDVLAAQKKEMSIEQIYLKAVNSSKLITKVVENATMAPGIYNEADYSYSSNKFAGPGFFMAGDSACFLDPLLSSGVHLATFSAMLAVAAISSISSGEVTESEAVNFYEKSYRQAYLRFMVFLSAFYDVNRGRDSYFWEAQQISQDDVDSDSLKQAFLRLITGVKDLSDAKSDTHRFVIGEMVKRIEENLSFRKDKDHLANLDENARKAADANANFFSSVEGMFSLKKEDAIDGMYVVTTPVLKLARV